MSKRIRTGAPERARPGCLEPVLPLIQRCKNFREVRLTPIIKRAARLIGALVEFTRFLVRQLKGGVGADVFVIRLREMIVLVLPIECGTDKGLYRRLLQQGIGSKCGLAKALGSLLVVVVALGVDPRILAPDQLASREQSDVLLHDRPKNPPRQYFRH